MLQNLKTVKVLTWLLFTAKATKGHWHKNLDKKQHLSQGQFVLRWRQWQLSLKGPTVNEWLAMAHLCYNVSIYSSFLPSSTQFVMYITWAHVLELHIIHSITSAKLCAWTCLNLYDTIVRKKKSPFVPRCWILSWCPFYAYLEK